MDQLEQWYRLLKLHFLRWWLEQQLLLTIGRIVLVGRPSCKFFGPRFVLILLGKKQMRP